MSDNFTKHFASVGRHSSPRRALHTNVSGIKKALEPLYDFAHKIWDQIKEKIIKPVSEGRSCQY